MTFEQVYDANFDFVWRALRQLGVREHDVADAAQDVFLVVHRQLATFEGRSKLTTWLFAICARVASGRRRMAHVRREVVGSDVIDLHAAASETAEESASRRQQATVLDEILGAMPDDQRAVFVMFEMGELSGDEIAEALEIPVGTARSRLRLARDSFRDAVARWEARGRFAAQRAQGGVR